MCSQTMQGKRGKHELTSLLGLQRFLKSKHLRQAPMNENLVEILSVKAFSTVISE